MRYTTQIILILSFNLFTIASVVITMDKMIKKRKNAQLSTTITSLLGALGTLITFLCSITLPVPSIKPYNGETLPIDTKELEITIESERDPIFEIYYTLNGDDPKDGDLYEGTFKIYKASTVCARSKFLWWWSDSVERNYIFGEKIDFNDHMLYAGNENTFLPKPSTEDSETYESTEESKTDTEIGSATDEQETQPQIATTDSTTTIEGINESEGYNLLTYINQNRIEAGLAELTWNSELELEAQYLALNYATGNGILGFRNSYVIGRQCNGAKDASMAVSDWMTGNNYIPSEAEYLLSQDFTQLGGALYYLPDGNEYGYHYFWVICLL